MRLPDGLNDTESYADFLGEQVKELENYVLVGDSFGAFVALAYATRKPKGLQALVMSGGFARDPVSSPILKVLSRLAPLFPGPLYRALTLRVHAFFLRSKFDSEGERPWSQMQTLHVFRQWTPYRAYVNRVHAVARADYLTKLKNIQVPTLLITPEEDNLVGPKAAKIMLAGIPNAKEEVLPRTGHMFRFSHPSLYSTAVKKFLEENLSGRGFK